MNKQIPDIEISVVIPVYGCAGSLHELCSRLGNTLSGISEQYEIILVDDHGPDMAWPVISGLASGDSRIKGIQMSRNYGQHYATRAGLDHSCGRWVAVMDCDLQDRPEEIERLYRKAAEGYDYVLGSRAERVDGFFKKFTSGIFHRVLNYLGDYKINHRNTNFGIYSRKVINAALAMREESQVLGMALQLIGFKKAELEVSHQERAQGKSSYNFMSRLSLGLDMVLSYTDRPLRLLFQFGLLVSLVSFAIGIYFFVSYLFRQQTVSGWTSLMVSLFFISGLLFSAIGFIGLYIGKIFRQVKQRPIYHISEKLNLHE